MTKSILSASLFSVLFHFAYGQFETEQVLVSAPDQTIIAPFLEELAYADLDNNGFVDIIGAYSQKMFAWMNMGDGTFTQQFLFDFSNLGFTVRYILPYDYDNDGKIDIAMTLNASGINGSLHIFKNTLDGFVPGLQFSNIGGHGLSVADMDGDGFDDLLVGAFNKVIVYKNNQGLSLIPQNVPIPAANGTITEVQSADFTNNGHPDIVAMANYRRISITPNLGNMSFAAAIPIHSPENNSLSASRLRLDDLNGNGKPNISVFYRNVNNLLYINELRWFELNASGQIESDVIILPYTNSGYYGFDVGDIDGDGDVEMIFTYENNVRSGTLVRYNPTSAEGALTEYLVNKEASHVEVKNLMQNVDLVDLSGNGRPDVVLNSQPAYTLGVVYNDGNLTTPKEWYNQFSHIFHTGSVYEPRSEDVEGSGNKILTYLKDFHSNSLLMRTHYNSYEGFSEEELLSFNKWENGKLSFRFGRGNQDAFPDVFIASQESNGTFKIKVYAGLPSGGFFSPVTVFSIPGPLRQVLHFELSDFNNDGLSDLVIQRNPFNSAATTFILINNGNGTFSVPQTIAASAGLLTLADIDNDGYTDLSLLVGSQLQLYRNDGSGQFTLQNTVPTNPGNPSLIPTQVHFVQRLPNTAPDLIYTETTSISWTNTGPLVRIRTNQGNFQFAPVENFQEYFTEPASIFRLQGFADVTNNGLSDVIYLRSNPNSVFYKANDGNGQYGENKFIDSYTISNVANHFVFDATGNGYADYVFVSQLTGLAFTSSNFPAVRPNYMDIRHNDLCIPDPDCDESPQCTLPYPTVTGLNQSSTSAGTALSWNPVPGSAGCRIEGGLANGQGPVTTFTLQQPEASTFFVPASQLTAGMTYRWRVRCGCNLSVAGNWSPYAMFTLPLFPVNAPLQTIQNFEANIYPNPLNGLGFISFSLPDEGTVQFNLYDLAGKLVYQHQYAGVSGFQSHALQIHHLPGGVYISQLVAGDLQHASRLVLVHE